MTRTHSNHALIYLREHPTTVSVFHECFLFVSQFCSLHPGEPADFVQPHWLGHRHVDETPTGKWTIWLALTTESEGSKTVFHPLL